MLDINLKNSVNDAAIQTLINNYGNERDKLPKCNCSSTATPCKKPSGKACVPTKDTSVPNGGVYTKLDLLQIITKADGSIFTPQDFLKLEGDLQVIQLDMGSKIDELNSYIIQNPTATGIDAKKKDLEILYLFYEEVSYFLSNT